MSAELFAAQGRLKVEFEALRRSAGAHKFTKSWFSVSELAALKLPGFPGTRRGWTVLARREGWETITGKMRQRRRSGGGVEFHIDLVRLEMLARIK